jgi:hypothetical protein
MSRLPLQLLCPHVGLILGDPYDGQFRGTLSLDMQHSERLLPADNVLQMPKDEI